MRRVTDSGTARVAAAAKSDGGGGGTGRPARPAGSRHLAAVALAAVAFALAAVAAVAEPPDAHAHPDISAATECSVLAVPAGQGGGIGDGTVHAIKSIVFRSPNGTYAINDTIDIRISLNHTSTGDSASIDFGSSGYSTGPDGPSSRHLLEHSRFKLETGNIDRFAEFLSVENNHLDYRYTVQPGDSSDDLDYHSQTALYWTFSHGRFVDHSKFIVVMMTT